MPRTKWMFLRHVYLVYVYLYTHYRNRIVRITDLARELRISDRMLREYIKVLAWMGLVIYGHGKVALHEVTTRVLTFTEFVEYFQRKLRETPWFYKLMRDMGVVS